MRNTQSLRSIAKTISQRCGALWGWLTIPRNVTDPVDRRRAQLLTSLLLVLMSMCFLTAIEYIFAFGAAFWQHEYFAQVAGFMIFLAVAYGLSLASHYALATGLIIIVLDVGLFWMIITSTNPGTLFFLTYLTLPVLLSSLFLSLRTTVILSALSIGNILLYAALFQGIALTNDTPFTFVSMMSLLILIATHHRNQVEKERQAELSRANEELEKHRKRLEMLVEARTGELRRTKESVETLLNNTPDAILLLESDGTIQVGNPAFHTLFGMHIDQVTGQLPDRLVAAKDSELLDRALLMVMTENKLERIEALALRQDATTFDADIALAPIVETGVLQGVVCTIRDISMMKEAERLKDQFVSNVSHELRAPLTSLKLHHHLLEKNPGRLDRYLPVLQRETARLERTIEDVLVLSQLDQGQTSIGQTPVNLGILSGQYVTDRLPLAEERKLSLSYEGESDLPLVQADEGLINQVLGVFLSNALNYTPAGGQIVINTHTRESDGLQWVGLSVKDSGPGISPEDQEQLFTRFFRGKVGRDSKVRGTGLGLAIAREIIKHHQGYIQIESKPGQGTIFKIWLPVEEAERA